MTVRGGRFTGAAAESRADGPQDRTVDLRRCLASPAALNGGWLEPDRGRLPRVLELFPDTCFAGWVDYDLVATSMLATYQDRVGWIGIVLVDENHRRQGYGSAVFERALETGGDADLDVVGLDATDAGRPVYNNYGFKRTSGIDRWRDELVVPYIGSSSLSTMASTSSTTWTPPAT